MKEGVWNAAVAIDGFEFKLVYEYREEIMEQKETLV